MRATDGPGKRSDVVLNCVWAWGILRDSLAVAGSCGILDVSWLGSWGILDDSRATFVGLGSLSALSLAPSTQPTHQPMWQQTYLGHSWL